MTIEEADAFGTEVPVSTAARERGLADVVLGIGVGVGPRERAEILHSGASGEEAPLRAGGGVDKEIPVLPAGALSGVEGAVYWSLRRTRPSEPGRSDLKL